ncbi:MAG: hypothetical protein A3F18_04250 [Legionellales bacterium RIFCSPHIGHO2_12_FULL_37_14]|nr:MAG: hypothetical protein A3F18_04250 [Legionellales bacterium RIFCSPHIGHO2_12_FULL_37_14]
MSSKSIVKPKNSIFKTFFFPIILLTSIVLGAIFGVTCKDYVKTIQPLGDLFLNLLLTLVVPLVFFSISSSITKMQASTLRYTFISYIGLFLVLGIIAAIYMRVLILFFPINPPNFISATNFYPIKQLPFLEQITNLLSVKQFNLLFSTNNMLALIIFAAIFGISTHKVDKKGVVINFLHNAEAIFLQAFSILMYLAPIGFFAYFANIVQNLGEQLVQQFLAIACLYFIGSLGFLIIFFSLYAYLCQGFSMVRIFWKNLTLPALMAIATCSSAATIPANIKALQKMQVKDTIAETIIPFGTLLHKQGSIMGAIVKMAALFSFYNLPFDTTLYALISTIGVALLVGSVIGAIASGGILGDILIINIFGFDQSALYLLTTISVIIEIPATLLNVSGNTIAGIIIKKLFTHKPSSR